MSYRVVYNEKDHFYYLYVKRATAEVPIIVTQDKSIIDYMLKIMKEDERVI